MRIALCGEARSGKDTVAEIIRFVRFAFGDYMKYEYYEENPHMRGKPKNREHMIAWSQPKVEEDNLIWVNKLERDLNLRMKMFPNEDYTITDLRQPHEEKWCRDNGFHIVRVHAHVLRRDLRARNLGEKLGKDLPYEVKADFHIYNDGSLEDLQSQVDNLLDCLNETEMKRRRL
ncbi:hypothetical protein [Bacillus cereus]|uniref:deoxynucleotide monophosphate kinase family protein n=1 Tax=Bacillus cereus TaxID=1396 RepID=UPI000BF253A6|nr:hypothetical protein [Bacillus cereus]PFQ13490.1 hypothetical protein COK14_09050 [Bacillus cereus]